MTTDSPPSDRPPREAGPVGQLARLFLVQLLAVIAVAAVIAVVFTAAGRGTGRINADAGSSGSTSTASTTATATRQSTSPTVAAPGSPTAVTPPASAVPPPAATVPASPTAAPTTSAGDDRPKVDVLNQSSPGGTAAHTADNVSTLGWRVGRIDNFVGNVRATTVYYPPGFEAQAKKLAKALPGPQRVLPGFSTLSGSRLSLILVG